MSNPEERIVKIIDKDLHTRGASVKQVGSLGALAVSISEADSENLPGLNVPSADAVVVTYPSSDVEVYTYKTGGTSGTTVATITVTYSDGALVSVVKEVV